MVKNAQYPRGEPPVSPSVALTNMVGAPLALLRWWLDNDMPYSPEQVHEILQQLTTPGVSAVFEKTS
jgi:hypothetical protein